jgi:aspartyl-tRNA(Asn)/glutamyl-tRNA(Gln) amidotransferase subunit A
MITRSAHEMSQAMASGEITSVALTQLHFDRIAKVDTDVHAFLYLDHEGASKRC